MTPREKIAQELWHRFAPGHIEEWEDETHKAEYLDAADAVIAYLPNDTWTITVRNRWSERIFFAFALLTSWPRNPAKAD